MSTKQLDDYVDKLYNGILRKYKEEQEWKTFYPRAVRLERESPTKSQMDTVIDTCSRKCVVCKDPYDECFEFHHKNGDSSLTTETNLVIVCPTCHKKIHTRANSKLANRKVRTERKKNQEPPRKKHGKKATKEPYNPLYVDNKLLEAHFKF